MASSSALTGPWAKLRRAEEHLASLFAEVLEYGIGDATELPPPIGKRYDPEEQCFIYFATEFIDTPTRWRVIAGDVVHNLRSALDHLAWILSDSGAHARSEATVQFPLAWDPSKSDAEIARRIPGITPMHQSIIRRYQPCTREGDLRKNHPFAALQRMSNDDKHRTLMLLPSRNTSCEAYVPEQFDTFTVTRKAARAPRQSGQANFEDVDFTPGSELLRIWGEPVAGHEPDVQVRWTCKGSVVVAATGRSIEETFNEIVAMTDQLLTEFEGLL